MTFFSFFYCLLLHIMGIAFLPKMAFDAVFKGKYRNSFLQKFGKDFPKIDKKGQSIIWVHAVSYGETLAVAPLIRKIKAESNAPLILLSTATETGHACGKKNIPEADWHVYLPFDLPYVIRPIVKQVKPEALILVETDFWYFFQQAVKEQGGKIGVVNAKLSDRSYRRFKSAPFIAKYLLNPIDLFCVQGNVYLERFRNLQIEDSKLTVTGNLKISPPKERLSEERERDIKQRFALTDKILTLGSTHDPEEKIWISRLPALWDQFPNLKVFLVPRHLERLTSIIHLLEEAKISFAKWTTGSAASDEKVILVDQMGQLRFCYQLSDLAFVGGSLTSKVGGHNIIEPCFYHTPVLYGPNMHGQPDLLHLMEHYQAGVQITETTALSVTLDLLSNPSQRKHFADQGTQLVDEQTGALEKTYNLLKKNISIFF